MAFSEEKNRNRARIFTIVFHALLLVWFAMSGLKYQDPRPEDGIAINFGYEEDGSGSNTAAAPAPETPVEQPEAIDPVEEPVETAPPTESAPDPTPPVTEPDVATQDVEDAAAIQKREEEERERQRLEQEQRDREAAERAERERQERIEQQRIAAEEAERKRLADEAARKKAEAEAEAKRRQEFMNRLGGSGNSNTQGQGEGEGETQGGGDQGDPNGDPTKLNRTGNGGVGNSGNYKLGNRNAINKPIPNYDCQGEGRVVVRIRVDHTGKVVEATGGYNVPGGPQSNFSDLCLKRRAEEAAKRTTWETGGAPGTLQTGYIVYNFKRQ